MLGTHDSLDGRSEEDVREQTHQTAGMQITTQRLRLRPLTRSDEGEVAALAFTHPEIRERALSQVREGFSEREWEKRGYGPCAVSNVSDDRFLGRVGLLYREQFRETELSWVLRADAQGRGYATEAAAALLRWGLITFELPYVTAMIRPDNAASIRVAERLGMTPLRDDSLGDENVIVYYASRDARPGEG